MLFRSFAATGGHHSTGLDPVRLMAALTAARADALWAGWEFITDPAELARLCEREGIAVIGPGSDVSACSATRHVSGNSLRAWVFL